MSTCQKCNQRPGNYLTPNSDYCRVCNRCRTRGDLYIDTTYRPQLPFTFMVRNETEILVWRVIRIESGVITKNNLTMDTSELGCLYSIAIEPDFEAAHVLLAGDVQLSVIRICAVDIATIYKSQIQFN